MKDKKLYFVPILTIAFLIAVWCLVASTINTRLILPTPNVVFKETFRLFGESAFYVALFGSLQRVVTSFVISLIFAIVFALISNKIKVFRLAFYPVVIVTRAVPTMCVIFLCIIYFKPQTSPLIVSFLVLFPMLYTSVLTAIEGCDKELLEMSEIYKVTKTQKLINFYLPSVSAIVYSDSVNAFALNVKLIIAAEALSQTKLSLGGGMQIARLNLETATLFSYMIVAILLSYIVELLMRLLRFAVRRIIDARNKKYC